MDACSEARSDASGVAPGAGKTGIVAGRRRQKAGVFVFSLTAQPPRAQRAVSRAASIHHLDARRDVTRCDARGGLVGVLLRVK